MKSLLKLALFVAIGVFIKTRYFAGGSDLKKMDLVPLNVEFIQGERPPPGKAIFIEFWATTSSRSGDCITFLNDLQAKYQHRGLDVVAISDEESDVVQAYAQRRLLSYSVAIDRDRQYATALGIRSTPYAVLVNRDGRVVWQGYPSFVSEAKLENVLGTPAG